MRLLKGTWVNGFRDPGREKEYGTDLIMKNMKVTLLMVFFTVMVNSYSQQEKGKTNT